MTPHFTERTDLAGATIKVANLVYYICQALSDEIIHVLKINYGGWV